MGTEAQKLISLSLEKIANCRRRRREMSLHKNLLLTTIINKARFAIMEETYYMMNSYDASSGTERPVDYAADPIYYNGNVSNGSSSLSLSHRPSSYGEPPHYLQPVADEDMDMVPASGMCGTVVTDNDDVMDWEESADNHHQSSSSPSILHQSTAAVVIMAVDTRHNEADKENISPSSTTIDDDDDVKGQYAATCCEQMFGACRSPDCQFLVRNGQKRTRMGSTEADDDDQFQQLPQSQTQPSKKLKWDEIDARDLDPESDTSHALRLVSVLSATLSGNQQQPAVRLVRSISTPDLCSKQAKDAMDMVQERPVLPTPIAV